MWANEYGPHEALIKRSMRFGYEGKIAKPLLHDDLQTVWEAFVELNKGRQSGFDVCALEMKEIVEYLKLWHVSGNELIEGVKLVRSLDLKALELYRNK